jgi:hypothetical protein
MAPSFRATRDHVMSFIDGLRSDGQVSWDLRFDFVSHSASDRQDGVVFRARSVRESALIDSMYPSQGSASNASLFTGEVSEFRAALDSLDARGDEANLIALDMCLDFPWRASDVCHRVVIMLTDEPLETGLIVSEQREMIPRLIEKIHCLGVLLFVIGPDSKGYHQLSLANRSSYDIVPEGGGLSSVDFRSIMSQIGRSVSVSRVQRATVPTQRALFGQDGWNTTEVRDFGGR